MGNSRSFRRKQQSPKEKRATASQKPKRYPDAGPALERFAQSQRRWDWSEEDTNRLPQAFRQLFVRGTAR